MSTLRSGFPGRAIRALVVAAAALTQATCGGGGGGGGSSSGTAPSISNFTYGPSAVYVDSGGGTQTVVGDFTFNDPDGDVASARLVTLDSTGKVVVDVTEPIVGVSGMKTGEVTGEVTVGTTLADTYTIRLSVLDSKGHRSNELTGTFRVSEFPWVAKTSMPAPRYEFATAVVDGRIYVLGGNDPTAPFIPAPATARVDVYDPATDAWSAAPAMPVALRNHVAATVGGRIYVAGGQTDFAPGVKTVYVFDPATAQWTQKASMPYELRESAATAAGGRLWVFGGDGMGWDTRNALSYDPVSNTWSSHAPMLEDGRLMTAVTVGDKPLLIGGYGLPGYSQLVEQYDPQTDLWTRRSDLPWPPVAETAAAVVGGTVYVAGGNNWDPALESVVAYDPAADRWSGRTAMPVELHAPRAQAVGGRMYVFEGGVTLEYTPGNDIL